MSNGSRSVEERYYQDFGEQIYSTAVHNLWEDYCAGYSSCPDWPPTLEQVKKAIDAEQTRRYYENERR